MASKKLFVTVVCNMTRYQRAGIIANAFIKKAGGCSPQQVSSFIDDEIRKTLTVKDWNGKDINR